ncbi:MAG: hypothetical protein DRP84_08205 [Spirochaetes bacterium]|nr:MAG: hypothetical protein DRP84_08205 [Spirochaetota bacterium]
MEFYSHIKPKEIPLKCHLQDVADKSRKIICSKNLNKINQESIADISYLIGVSHDFGKYTTFFQEKLKGLRNENDLLARHGLISALFAFEVVKEYIKIKNLGNKTPYRFLPLIAYFVVKRHHLDLNNIRDEVDVRKLFDQGFRNIYKQLHDIWNNKNQIVEEYKPLLRDYVSVEKIFDSMAKYKKEIKHSGDIEALIEELNEMQYFLLKKEHRDMLYYLLVQLFYSVLIDSDKKHAGDVREIERKELSDKLVENYIERPNFKNENESNINPIREEIRKSVLSNIEKEFKHCKIFTLTAPTGTGKTLTSLSAALKLRKLLKKELNLRYEPRIIYSLPFTSIIDQNFNVFYKVLKEIKEFKKYESEYLLKHHYLSDIFYKTKDIDKEVDIDESLALIESWESEIVVTTFIQLFYTLIGYKNRTLKKFHNIVNSIILLDEVQNIPIEYWTVIREILISMCKYFNCRVILMTATKPLIFEEGEYIELVDDYEKYFRDERLNRVCLHIDHDKKTINKLCNELNDFSYSSYLFVFNTIGSSLEFYEKIKNKIEDLNFEVFYLSTNILPMYRKQRIDEIKKAIEKNQKIIVISTQLIEAGVDIDCDCVYRDTGPLDSIIQVAGRCNRNKGSRIGNMYLLNLVRENGKAFTGIYGPKLIKITREILEEKNEVNERQFLDLIEDYFQKAKNEETKAKELVEALYNLYFYDKDFDPEKRKPISEFKLIKDEPYKVDVFIELDEEAKDVWQKYEEIINNKELKGFEKRNEFLKIKNKFYNYVISVDENKAENIPIVHNIRYVSNSDIKNHYDTETGFRTSNSPLII